MDHKITNTIVFLLIFNLIHAQEPVRDSLKAIVPEVSYTGDAVNVLSGGIRQGTSYLGMISFRLTARFWKGSSVYVNLANTHGGEPSAELAGDYQTLSNIEAGDHSYLQELWFRQEWRYGIISVGLQDLNIEYANVLKGAHYMNSSFGILPSVSGNIPAPVFPLTSLGISTRWNLLKNWNFLVAAFDGVPTDFEDNPHNLNWNLARKDGILFFAESQHDLVIHQLSGKLKTGAFLHQHLTNEEIQNRDTTVCRNNHGFYIMYEQDIWQSARSHKGLGFFMQIGHSPSALNKSPFYTGFGINYVGLLNKNGEDVAGIAVGYDRLRGLPGNETIIELNYQFPVLTCLFVQPDIQYIFNPAGTGEKLTNCLAVSFRFGINLGAY